MGVSAIELAIAIAGIGVALLLMWPRLANAPLWRATVTPLASIIGSGFLILGPILVDTFGSDATLAMALLCLAGYAFGWAIRFNIAQLHNDEDDGPWIVWGERVAAWALAFAYVVSVAYYLNLFGAFSARLAGPEYGELGRIITTVVYAVILVSGLTYGFGLLERLEQLSVSIKLAIIAALIAGLAVHTGTEVRAHSVVESKSLLAGWPALTMMFGLLVTVQGFETSRYLGGHYSSAQRQRSMQLAQWISSAIYLAYVALLSFAFGSGSFVLSETAIIDLMAGISAILAPLLILGALAAQFSAAVADTTGSGGLVCELTHRKVGPKKTYLGLVATGLVLTWAADVFQIVSFASRAFALYYGIQAALAFARARATDDVTGWRHAVRQGGFAALALLGLVAAILGTAVEGG